MKDKIIIHNFTDLSDFEVLLYVGVVIERGKVSKTGEGEQYCFVTTFSGGITVYSGRKNDTYTFKIFKE